MKTLLIFVFIFFQSKNGLILFEEENCNKNFTIYEEFHGYSFKIESDYSHYVTISDMKNALKLSQTGQVYMIYENVIFYINVHNELVFHTGTNHFIFSKENKTRLENFVNNRIKN